MIKRNCNECAKMDRRYLKVIYKCKRKFILSKKKTIWKTIVMIQKETINFLLHVEE